MDGVPVKHYSQNDHIPVNLSLWTLVSAPGVGENITYSDPGFSMIGIIGSDNHYLLSVSSIDLCSSSTMIG